MQLYKIFKLLTALRNHDTFKTFSNLIQSLEKDSLCLNDVIIYNKNGREAHLTKPCINNIYDFLVKPSIINIETTT